MSALHYLSNESVSAFIRSALQEDIGTADHSSLGAVPAHHQSTAALLVKEKGIIAGIELAEKIFHHYDSSLSVIAKKQDGQEICAGETALIIEGCSRSILSVERLVLNCLQRMSGIATYTRRLCALIAGTDVRVLDTRKTTPNFRLMEKWAVSIGGGVNHRFSLDESIILKDTHIDMAGGIEPALKNTKKYLHNRKDIKIEIEVRNIDEVKEVLHIGGIDAIMLDNMSVPQMKKAVQLIGENITKEASGGIDESTIREVAMCGVNYISVGKLTHSAPSIDMSIKATKNPLPYLHNHKAQRV